MKSRDRPGCKIECRSRRGKRQAFRADSSPYFVLGPFLQTASLLIDLNRRASKFSRTCIVGVSVPVASERVLHRGIIFY